MFDPMNYGDTGPIMGTALGDAVTEGATDALLFGVSAALIASAVIMLVFLVGTVYTAMQGNVPMMMLFAFALLTAISPILGIVGAIIALIIFAVRGDIYNGVFAIGGFLLGEAVTVIVGLIIGALMLV